MDAMLDSQQIEPLTSSIPTKNEKLHLGPLNKPNAQLHNKFFQYKLKQECEWFTADKALPLALSRDFSKDPTVTR